MTLPRARRPTEQAQGTLEKAHVEPASLEETCRRLPCLRTEPRRAWCALVKPEMDEWEWLKARDTVSCAEVLTSTIRQLDVQILMKSTMAQPPHALPAASVFPKSA
jgi:hypothetical protein